MNSEKVIVVYFSRTGRTKNLAREIAQKLNCAIEEIRTPTSYSGFFGYQIALLQAAFKMTPKIKPLQNNLTDYDLVIMGGPVWGGSICGPLRTFMEKYNKDFKNVAFIATQGGNMVRKNIFEKMKNIARKPPLATLDITERDFKNGLYKNSISSFISKLSLSNPKLDRKKIAERSRTETTF